MVVGDANATYPVTIDLLTGTTAIPAFSVTGNDTGPATLPANRTYTPIVGEANDTTSN
jgi:hypothetical protein